MHADLIAECWASALRDAAESKRLVLMYLASDIILQSRKETPELRDAFQDHLEEAVSLIHSASTQKTMDAIDRIVSIWEERGAFANDFIARLRLAARAPPEAAAADAATLLAATPAAVLTTATAAEVPLADVVEAVKKARGGASAAENVHWLIGRVTTDVLSETIASELPDAAAADALAAKVRLVLVATCT